MTSPPSGDEAQKAPLVWVIVITFNGKRHLDPCFSSLKKTAYQNWHALLVDNASTDGSSEFVAREFPWVEIMRHATNLGFAAGNNRAMSAALAAGATYVVLLNDDTITLDSRWLHEAVCLAEQDLATGIIGFRLLDQIPQPPEAENPATIEVTDTHRIDGCALFLRASMLRRIGLLDEVYFAYAEEDDLEARAVRAGVKLRMISTPIYHFGGGTSKRFPFRFSYLQIRNSIRFSIKNRSWFRTISRIAKIFCITCSPRPLFLNPADGSHLRMRGKGNILLNFAAFIGGVMWNMIHLPATLRAKNRDNLRIQGT